MAAVLVRWMSCEGTTLAAGTWRGRLSIGDIIWHEVVKKRINLLYSFSPYRFFSSLSFYSERATSSTKGVPAKLNLIDVFFISSYDIHHHASQGHMTSPVKLKSFDSVWFQLSEFSALSGSGVRRCPGTDRVDGSSSSGGTHCGSCCWRNPDPTWFPEARNLKWVLKYAESSMKNPWNSLAQAH